MRRWMIVAALLALPAVARAQAVQQTVVDRATLAVQEMMSVSNPADRLASLRRARAVMICPRVFQAGLIVGGSGGICVLAARDGGGSWSAPAFYSMGSASLGLQIGIQDCEIMMMIMTDRGLAAIMDSQFKIGGDASVAFATAGSGVEGSSSGALHADIIAYSQSRGLFAGVSLIGSTLTTDTAYNHAYYGRDLAARQVVMQMEANNQGADPLRAILARFGTPAGEAIAMIPEPQAAGHPSFDPPRPPRPHPVQHLAAVPAPVLRETLPPPPPPPPH